MRNLILLGAVLLAFGCGTGTANPLIGTYKSESSADRIVLKDDGTYRLMSSERTSPSDVTGTYQTSAGKLQLFPTGTRVGGHSQEVTVSTDSSSLTIGDASGHEITYRKTSG